MDVRAKLAQLEGLAARGLVTAAERQALLRDLVKIVGLLLEPEVPPLRSRRADEAPK